MINWCSSREVLKVRKLTNSIFELGKGESEHSNRVHCKDCGDGRSVSRVMSKCVVCSAARNNTYPDAIDCDKS